MHKIRFHYSISHQQLRKLWNLPSSSFLSSSLPQSSLPLPSSSGSYHQKAEAFPPAFVYLCICVFVYLCICNCPRSTTSGQNVRVIPLADKKLSPFTKSGFGFGIWNFDAKLWKGFGFWLSTLINHLIFSEYQMKIKTNFRNAKILRTSVTVRPLPYIWPRW